MNKVAGALLVIAGTILYVARVRNGLGVILFFLNYIVGYAMIFGIPDWTKVGIMLREIEEEDAKSSETTNVSEK